jgi:hypothetical protein
MARFDCATEDIVGLGLNIEQTWCPFTHSRPKISDILGACSPAGWSSLGSVRIYERRNINQAAIASRVHFKASLLSKFQMPKS